MKILRIRQIFSEKSINPGKTEDRGLTFNDCGGKMHTIKTRELQMAVAPLFYITDGTRVCISAVWRQKYTPFSSGSGSAAQSCRPEVG